MRPRIAYLSLLLVCGGCAGPDATEGSRLGIAHFETFETDEITTVIGRGDDGLEIGRLELVHGRFVLSDNFAEGYDNRSVVGRKLTVAVAGQVMQWETEGFSPTLSLPAHPPSQSA